MKNDPNEEIKITRDEFARLSAELLASIHLDGERHCEDANDLHALLMTDLLLTHYTKDLMNKIFNSRKLEIEKEEK